MYTSKIKNLLNEETHYEKQKMNTRILSDFLHADISKDKKQKAIAISDALFLCYFFRNNLFHGTKHIYQLKDYIDDFIQIENFMTSLMKYLAQNESEKY